MMNTVPSEDLDQIFCLRCYKLCKPGRVPETHYVHGHLACAECGKVLEDCCQGECFS